MKNHKLPLKIFVGFNIVLIGIGLGLSGFIFHFLPEMIQVLLLISGLILLLTGSLFAVVYFIVLYYLKAP